VTASLLTRRLPLVIALSLAVGVAGALSGFGLALLWNVSISGMIAAMLGALFGATLLLAPEQGLVAQAIRRRRQRHQFATEMLVVHLATHENTEAEARESAVAHLEKELNWEPQTVQRILARAGDAGLIARQNGSLQLTPRGRDLAQQVATR
jgi:manganese/zinc/iron transport system permease protein